jgi:hypothetical protein
MDHVEGVAGEGRIKEMGHATAKGKVKAMGKLRIALAAIGCALSMGMATQATAALITFEHEATGSITGTLDGVPFSTNSVRLVGIGETEDVVHFGSVFVGWHTSAFVEIAGLGTFDFITATGSGVNNSSLLVQFIKAPLGQSLTSGPVDPGFADWDMQTSIGPITGDGSLLQWGFTNMQVTDGPLIFDDGPVVITFTATVPAPSALTLFLAAGALGRRRRRS